MLVTHCLATIQVSLIFSALDPSNQGSVDLRTQRKGSGGQWKKMEDRHPLQKAWEGLEQGNFEEKLKLKLSWLFQMFDQKSLGSVRLGEFISVFSSLYRAEGLDRKEAEIRAIKVFAVLDRDQDGEVTEEEFVRKCLEDSQLVSGMAEMEMEEDLEANIRASRSVDKRAATIGRYYRMSKFRCDECTFACKTDAGFETHKSRKHGPGGSRNGGKIFRPAVTDREITAN